LTGDSICFDHSQLLIVDSFHASLLGNVLAHQSIEVLIAAALPNSLWIGKVDQHAKGLIDGLVIRKLLAVVHRQNLPPGAQGKEPAEIHLNDVNNFH
jgi:hypothetical protein